MKKLKISKTILALVLAMVMAGSAFALAGCSKDSKSSRSDRRSSRDDDDDDDDDEDDEDEDDEDEDEDDEDEDKKDKKKDKSSDKKTDSTDVVEDVKVEKEEVFDGYTDTTIKMMAEEYEEMGYIVEPIFASDIGAKDYNYIEGFTMYLKGQEEYAMNWGKFESNDDAEQFVKDVWIANCEGYIDYDAYGMYGFYVDGYYAGSVTTDGLLQFVPYEGDGRENNASPSDFDDPTVSAVCKELQDKGFKVEKGYEDNTFTAYGVNEDRRHVVTNCKKYKDLDDAKESIERGMSSMYSVDITYEDNSDGSVNILIEGDDAYHIFPIEGTISADGVSVLTNIEFS